MSDRRLTPANGRVAHLSLLGKVVAERFVEGQAANVVAPLTDLLARPAGPRDRQLLMGDAVLVLERAGGFAFVQAQKDGYCGYIEDTALGPAEAATHWLAAPASHLYPAPDLKTREVAALSLGARLTIRADRGRFCETSAGSFVPTTHLRAIGAWLRDPAAVAESFLGTPYLWGGNSRAGIDCSGLVQVAHLACGLPCPADSDLQLAALGAPLPEGVVPARGDLFFWKGHVAMALGDDALIHANGYQMAVGIEGIADCISRIAAQGEGPLLAVKRITRGG